MLDFEALWAEALPFGEFTSRSAEYCRIWEGLYAIARVPAWALEAVPPGVARRFLVIVEDWCGDGPSSIAPLAKLAAQAPGLELRIVGRDDHPELMDRYLTNGARSIPIVVALDGDFRELGHWGPRPTELQAWVMANKATIPKSELYPQVRKWYARDQGLSTLREVLETAGLPAAGLPAVRTPIPS
jgi:hypothetical protein